MGSGRVRLVDVGARSMPGRGALFMLSVEMLAPGMRRLSVVCVRCMVREAAAGGGGWRAGVGEDGWDLARRMYRRGRRAAVVFEGRPVR